MKGGDALGFWGGLAGAQGLSRFVEGGSTRAGEGRVAGEDGVGDRVTQGRQTGTKAPAPHRPC